MKLKLLFTLGACLLCSTLLFAPPPPPSGPSVPIDGGITWLLAAGGAYGIKKLRDTRKEKR